MEQGDKQAALKNMEEAYTLSQKDALIGLLLAMFYMTIQKYDEAIVILEALQQKVPVNTAAKNKSVLLFILGNCYLYKGNHEKAIYTLESALSYTPEAVTVLTGLGEAYLKIGETEKAGKALAKALAINPNNPRALYYKGICFEKTGNSEEAQKSFQEGYTNGKRYLTNDGEDYYLMFLICQKIAKSDEGKKYKAEAKKLLFTYVAPWKQK